MSDLIKKTILAGLGILSLTRKKAEEVAKSLIKRGELAKTQEAKFIKDLMKHAERGKREMEKKIEKTVKKTLARLDFPSRKELDQIKARIEQISKRGKKSIGKKKKK